MNGGGHVGTIRATAAAVALVVLATAGGAAQQSGGDAGKQYTGTWKGTWEGLGRSGDLELTLERTENAALGGHIVVTGDPSYKAVFRRVAFDGAKMTAAYDSPDSEAVEVVITATFEGTKAAGEWIAQEKGGGNEVGRGTWQVARK
jgi:hypothetical protein